MLLLLAVCSILQAGAVHAEVVEPNVALWAEEIEYRAGEVLLIKPRLPSVGEKALDTYELRLELPAALTEREINLDRLDAQGSYLVRPEERRHEVEGDRQAFIFRPALERHLGMEVTPEATYTFSCLAKAEGIVGNGFQLTGYFRDQHTKPIVSYPAYITFDQGTYDWKPFTVELQAPQNARHLVLLIIKWQDRATYGTLYVDALSLTCDREPGRNLMLAGDLERADGMSAWPSAGPLRPVEAPRPGSPGNLALRISGTEQQVAQQSGYWLPIPAEPVRVSFDEPFMLPTLALDVPADFAGEHTVRWSVVADGAEALAGEARLVPAPETPGPEGIELTIWLAESMFERLPHDVQEMYLQRLRRLGLNGVMPTVREPVYGEPLDEIDFTNWTAQLGRRNGMEVRAYLSFLYAPVARAYCEKHPEYWAVTWTGKKTPDCRVCLTHGLDGDKYDDEKTGIRGGRENPWLGRLCEAVKRAVQANDLQGVWWDFEIAGVPIRKERPIPYNPEGHRQVCTDLRCRRGFADYAKLDHVPSVEEIMSDPYYERWDDFKCWQHTRVWALMREAAREANPQADFRIYSGTPGPYSRQAYGVDWTMAAKVIDVAMSVHTPYNSEAIAKSYYAASEAGGRRNPLLMSVMVNGYDMNEHVGCWRTRPRLTNQLLQTVIDWDCIGFALTGIWGLDSQFNGPIREAAAVFAEYEELLATGRHDDTLLSVKPDDAEYALWLAKDEQRMVGFFFNNSGETEEAAIEDTTGWAVDGPAEDMTRVGAGLRLRIPAYEHRVVEFGR